MKDFWNINHAPESIAFIENDNKITYGLLEEEVTLAAKNFDGQQKKLIFLFCKNTYSSIVIYLAALKARQAICLLPIGMEKNLLLNLIDTYQPDWIYAPEEELLEIRGYEKKPSVLNYCTWKSSNGNQSEDLYAELAVLLSTSGTTGSPKMVRLSYANLSANAESIKEYLDISPMDRPITTLPMQYSYGLSVINSHLLAGSSIVLSDDPVISKSFWQKISEHGVTSLAGVPYTYQMLHRLGFKNMELPSIKKMTQAGGRLADNLQEYFADACSVKNISFFIMYGQTEATARISYLPPVQLSAKRGSIGIPIPGGKLYTDSNSELIYEGKNVMLGYATSKKELSLPDENLGVLRTGDIATMDTDGYYFITGRLKRFIKLFGLRINLDDVEKTMENLFKTRFFCVGNDERLYVVSEKEDILDEAKKEVLRLYKLHHSVVQTRHIEEVPILDSGKVDYHKLSVKVGIR
ncbi:AMP-binding protein [Saccharibacillus deserti]|uniref:AMP-binding protein n=1 Tax=Saccharibacillus deserti TaxID=1634444 RepID=UPI001551CAFC|nr:AMP-binding protein [Saccharibacillus deserti]